MGLFVSGGGLGDKNELALEENEVVGIISFSERPSRAEMAEADGAFCLGVVADAAGGAAVVLSVMLGEELIV